ncbi:beta-ketoacyl-[acyl-carrier-protein] synthase family protein [Thiohalospira sp.]|uniref:beta-ketoacyl-[acyl-carrier-protein] synthase family protein n=1 Tax=Thiohalospira sp. TaxID=3080549 RepID=UPI00397EC4B2
MGQDDRLVFSASTQVSALGAGREAARRALRSGVSGLRPWESETDPLPTWVGWVDGLEAPLTGSLAPFDCRNNRLALATLESDGFLDEARQAVQRYGTGRIGVFVGTSTSGILSTEQAYRQRDPETGALPPLDYCHTHNLYATADLVRTVLGLEGPAMVVSTACSSSAKVFAVAQRHLDAGLCDAAIVGGVDSFCLSTFYGFHSLGLVSARPCRPWDRERDGINLGEAGGFVLLERAARANGGVALLGYGESSDAHHMSTPHPEGRGAGIAMRRALASAGMEAREVDYLNLHGTATVSNDQAEDRAVTDVFGPGMTASSTKGWTGHTLGGAGIIEALFCQIALEDGYVPATLNTEHLDPGLHSGIVREGREQPLRRVMSNSFGFGGSNCSLILGGQP